MDVISRQYNSLDCSRRLLCLVDVETIAVQDTPEAGPRFRTDLNISKPTDGRVDESRGCYIADEVHFRELRFTELLPERSFALHREKRRI